MLVDLARLCRPYKPGRVPILAEDPGFSRNEGSVAWATKSFQQGEIQQSISLAQAIGFARSRDTPTLLETVAEAGTGMTQTGVVAVAAMVLRFGEDAAERDWGWSVMERVKASPTQRAETASATTRTIPALSTSLF